LPFPQERELAAILDLTTRTETPELHAVAGRDRVLAMRKLVRGVVAAEHLQRYIARLVLATHPDHPDAPEITRKYVRYGASPRGGQVLTLAAKVGALRDRRVNVAVEDIRPFVLPAFRHRLILNFAGEADGVTTDDIIGQILAAVPVPEPAA
ncbi:MAG TPA: AAA family ATPase, partial [bacterium]|nr:AAA family ATPase [bacterium]